MEKTSSNHHYLVILCGGSGPRLWPLSTANNPKQFLELFEHQTLLQNTITRCLKVVAADHLYIISNQKYASKLKSLKGHLILEPQKRNTALAISLATAIITKKDPEAIITTTPADHRIQDNRAFAADLKSAAVQALDGTIVAIGIHPTSANPSYGYLKKSQISNRVLKFIEKPPISRAKILIKNSAWFWNSGIYTFKATTFKHSLSAHNHHYYQSYLVLLENPKNIKKIYQESPSLSFEKVIAEKSHNLSTISAHFDWSDVGEWRAIYRQLYKDENQIALIGKDTQYVSYQSSHCLLKTEANKLIGLVGVKNIAVIDSPHGLLICKLPLSSHVRDIVATIVSDPKRIHFFTNDHR